MPIPGFQDLMYPVLRASSMGEVRTSEVIEKLAVEFSLSDDERSLMLQSGRQESFSNRVNWAKSYLGMAGLVELTKRAHFKITEEGLKVLSQRKHIDVKYLSTIPTFRKRRKLTNDHETNEKDAGYEESTPYNIKEKQPPDEVMLNAQRELNLSLATELMQRIQSRSPAFFEDLVVRLLVKLGYGGSYHAVTKALKIGTIAQGGPRDHGVDGVIDQDMLGLDRVYVQVKRYAEDNKIGEAAIRTFSGSLEHYKASKGVFVTSSSFSEPAKRAIESLSKRIVLIDGKQLTDLMIQHNVGCIITETLYIKKVDEELFSDTEE